MRLSGTCRTTVKNAIELAVDARQRTSVLEYKVLFFLSKTSSSLTKYIGKCLNIFNIKLIYYKYIYIYIYFTVALRNKFRILDVAML